LIHLTIEGYVSFPAEKEPLVSPVNPRTLSRRSAKLNPLPLSLPHITDTPTVIAIGGIPGSGKTTLSQTVTNALNAHHAALHPSSPPLAAFVPMDGYHLTRAQLSAMPDPVTAHARRGAEFTFDGAGFLQLVEALREPLTSLSKTIYAPSFDHAVKDPKAGDTPVGVEQRVVVFEGNCEFYSSF
jgi:pantothenate kinase